MENHLPSDFCANEQRSTNKKKCREYLDTEKNGATRTGPEEFKLVCQTKKSTKKCFKKKIVTEFLLCKVKQNENLLIFVWITFHIANCHVRCFLWHCPAPVFVNNVSLACCLLVSFELFTFLFASLAMFFLFLLLFFLFF